MFEILYVDELERVVDEEFATEQEAIQHAVDHLNSFDQCYVIADQQGGGITCLVYISKAWRPEPEEDTKSFLEQLQEIRQSWGLSSDF